MENLAVGDRVQLRRFPYLQGTMWSIESAKVRRGMVWIIKWDDPDENAYIYEPGELEKVTPPAKR
jgi:hypothetical protein